LSKRWRKIGVDLSLRAATVADAEELARFAIAAARERGFSAMRLFTPAAHARARRFYEREGWVEAGEEFHAPGPDLVLVEYRYRLAD
jgi:GNAT superfamily N-acetyltransferase